MDNSPNTTNEVVQTPPAERTGAVAPTIRTFLTWLAVLTCVLGWWTSRDLFLLSGGVEPSNPLLRMVCDSNAGAHSSCASLLTSSYSRVPSRNATEFATPWAVVGMGYFGFVGVWIGLMGLPRICGLFWHVPLILVLVGGAVASVFLVQMMAYTLGQWCAGCVLVHAMNGVILGSAIIGFLLALRPASPRPSTRLGVAAIMAACSIAWLPFPFALAMQQGSSSRALFGAYNAIVRDPEYVAWNWARQPLREIPDAGDRLSVGSADAANTLVVFSDFQCPVCRIAHDDVNKILEKHGSALRVVYRHFPLDSSCNAKERTMHPDACAAATAAEAALLCGGTDAGRRYRELLYIRQSELSRRAFGDWAGAVGLDRTAFETAMNGELARARIAEDVALGRSIGVTAVPAFFLNGRKIDRPLTPESWSRILAPEGAQSQPAK
jgi:protein-disulfide isomerase/uncharacterized membrane protein